MEYQVTVNGEVANTFNTTEEAYNYAVGILNGSDPDYTTNSEVEYEDDNGFHGIKL